MLDKYLVTCGCVVFIGRGRFYAHLAEIMMKLCRMLCLIAYRFKTAAQKRDFVKSLRPRLLSPRASSSTRCKERRRGKDSRIYELRNEERGQKLKRHKNTKRKHSIHSSEANDMLKHIYSIRIYWSGLEGYKESSAPSL